MNSTSICCCGIALVLLAAIPASPGGLPGAESRPPARRGWATWYSRASCKREGTGGGMVLMANGQPLDDTRLTCALWLTNSAGRVQRPDGRLVTVRCVTTGRSVQVQWTDNGPGRKARDRGVIVDLSRAAMVALAGKDGIRRGRVQVEVER